MQRFNNKAVVITGSGQGIGRAAALRIASEGGKIIVADLNAQAAQRTVDDIRALGTSAETFVGDISDQPTALALIEFALKHYGQIDSLVNNIGGATSLKPFQNWTPDEIIAEIHLSLLAPMWCCHAVLQHMIDRGYGHIVNIGADSVRNGLWNRAPYNIAKGGVVALTTSVAREAAPYGVTCNCLAPGPTQSEKDRLVERGERTKSGSESENFKEISKKVIDLVPMGRRATVEEQAAAIAFLASDDVGHITGQTISASGGMNML